MKIAPLFRLRTAELQYLTTLRSLYYITLHYTSHAYTPPTLHYTTTTTTETHANAFLSRKSSRVSYEIKFKVELNENFKKKEEAHVDSCILFNLFFFVEGIKWRGWNEEWMGEGGGERKNKNFNKILK